MWNKLPVTLLCFFLLFACSLKKKAIESHRIPSNILHPSPSEGTLPGTSWLQISSSIPAPEASEEFLQKGLVLYQAKCTSCHGDLGVGDGPESQNAPGIPRDFRQGIFKLRTTPSGSLPTDLDLFRTITRGIPGAGMEPAKVSELERWALVSYVQTLTFADEQSEKRDPVKIPEPPVIEEDAILRGRAVYLLLKCWDCHGVTGDGVNTKSLFDDWGFSAKVPNLTRPYAYKGGSTAKDLYRTLVTGLDGSPMPSYANDDEWLFSKKDFPDGWEKTLSRDLLNTEISEIQLLINDLPESLPKTENAKRKMADGYRFDLVSYLRTTFPSALK